MNALDTQTLANASLFRKLRALTRTMREGTRWRFVDEAIRHHIPFADGKMEIIQCPLTFVAGLSGCSPFVACEAAEQIGLTQWSTLIMRAADAKNGARSHRKLRSILLRAAGLKDK